MKNVVLHLITGYYSIKPRDNLQLRYFPHREPKRKSTRCHRAFSLAYCVLDSLSSVMAAWEVPFMFDAALRKKLIRSNSLEEVEKLLSEHPDLDAKRVYQEIEKHRPGSSEKLDLNEL